MTEDEMVGWHHRLNGQEFEQTPGDGEGQRGLACCGPWGPKEQDTTGQPNNRKLIWTQNPSHIIPDTQVTIIHGTKKDLLRFLK